MDSDQSMHESVLRSAVVLLCELKRKNIEDHALIDHGPLKLLYFIIEGQPIEELFWTCKHRRTKIRCETNDTKFYEF